MRTKLKLDDIRDVITEIKRKRGCHASNITKEEVKNLLEEKGSNGTSGPMVAEMLDEAVVAEILDYSNIPNRLKAAFVKTVQSGIDDATAHLRDLARREAEENDKLRAANSDLKVENAGLREELLSIQNAMLEKVSHLERELAEARGKISTFVETKTDLVARLQESREELFEKKEELADLRRHLQTAAEKEGASAGKVTSMSDRLQTCERDLLAAGQRAQLSEQKAAMHEERIQDLKAQIERLMEQIEGMSSENADLREDLLKATEEKADANARLDEQGKGTVKPAPSNTQSKSGKGKTKRQEEEVV